MSLDTLIQIGFWVSTIGFLIATLVTGLAWTKVGKSALRTVLSYLFIGTGIFFVITVFQSLGMGFFHIEDTSMDFWWHFMFYLAMASYFLGFRALTELGSDTPPKGAGGWGIFALVFLVLVFVLPGMTDTYVQAYMNSMFSSLGLHHFLAFAAAGVVAAYLVTARKNLGQIGKAIANPMLIAILALGLQHFWELLNESWKVVMVTSQQGEGGEKIFLTIAAICVTMAALRLKSFAKPS
ncbi:MAG: hypothetical protein JWO84_45 [Parcubacteria group bacterium]|nr:hypothetical protein [Parcubacteria group bacterium]